MRSQIHLATGGAASWVAKNNWLAIVGSAETPCFFLGFGHCNLGRKTNETHKNNETDYAGQDVRNVMGYLETTWQKEIIRGKQ